MFYTITIVCVAATILTAGSFISSKINLQLHQNQIINNLARYQLIALITGLLTMTLVIYLFPQSKQLLRIGQLFVIAEKEKWLGINGKSSWQSNGLQLLFFISLATGVFMFLGVKHTNSQDNFQWWFIPWVLLFSLTNSISEELIFRFALIGGLDQYYSKITIQLLSAVLFGLPHFYGNPGGITGVIMSGLLGYILCKATIETRGLSIAWTIHFIQDLIIFTALMMMTIKQNTNG